MEKFTKQSGMVEQKSRVKMKKTRAKGWVTVGMTSLALLGGVAVATTVDGADTTVQAKSEKVEKTAKADKKETKAEVTTKASTKEEKTTTVDTTTWTARSTEQIDESVKAMQNGKYTIVWGDTLSGITDSVVRSGINTNIDRIASLNQIQDKDLIIAGNILNIYGKGTDAVAEVTDAQGNSQGAVNLDPSKPAQATPQQVTDAKAQTQNTVKPNTNGTAGEANGAVVEKPVKPNTNGNTSVEVKPGTDDKGNGEVEGGGDVNVTPGTDENTGNGEIEGGGDINVTPGEDKGEGETKPEAVKATVTVTFVDAQGNQLAQPKVIDTQVGAKISASALQIKGYTLVGNTSQQFTVVGDQTIKFVYNKVETPVQKATVTVKYIDDKGNQLAQPKTIDTQVGATLSASALQLKGYDLVGNSSQQIKVTGNQTITFTYTKQSIKEDAFVTILYKNESGAILDSDSKVVKVGDTVTVKAKTIEGMEVVGDSTKTITVNDTSVEVSFTYKNGASYIDTDAVATAFIAKLNAYRTSHGRKALTTDANLMAGAKVRTQQEASQIENGPRDSFGFLDYNIGDHKLPNGQKFSQESHLKAFGSYVGENLVVGTVGITPDVLAQKMLDSWVASPGHLANIMKEEYTHVGFAVTALSDGGFVGITDFGRP